MGKCNLIAPPASTAGNFILFSQYAEDLTKQSRSEDFYRVTPSRYILMNIHADGISKERFAEYLQNYYENSCSIMRSQSGIRQYDPTWSRVLLWKALFNDTIPLSIGGRDPLLERPSQRGGGLSLPHFSDDVVYYGNINITSTRQVDGINYNEIYISVPQGAAQSLCPFRQYNSDSEINFSYNHDYISGYPDEEYPRPIARDWPSNDILIDGTDGYYADRMLDSDSFSYRIFGSNSYDSSTEIHSIDPNPVEKFTFNSVLVLYDIHKRSNADSKDIIVYRDIPMGIYLTGGIDENGITNPVTIWRTNDDIYGQGTSYGIRICTRYLSTQNQIKILDSTIRDTQDMYEQYASVMGKIGESQILMDEAVKSINSYQNSITGHIANIKNYTVNVPYIRNVGGKNYWFVNGKCLEVATTETTLKWKNY